MTTAGNQQVDEWVNVTAAPLNITYNFGPDDAPAYDGQTVQESFSEASGAYGFTLDDLTDVWRQANGNPQSVEAAAAKLFTSGKNATFVIDALNQIEEAHQGAAIDVNAFKPGALNGKTIGAKMVQTYTVKDPNDPTKYALEKNYDLFTELRVDANGNFTKWVKKSA